MVAIMVYLGKAKTRHRLLRLLRLIFLDKVKAAEKAKKLKDEYDLVLTPDMEELMEMGSLTEGIAERAKTEGYNKGKTEGIDLTIIGSIRNLMETVGWTAQQAMDALKIPVAEQVCSTDLNDSKAGIAGRKSPSCERGYAPLTNRRETKGE